MRTVPIGGAVAVAGWNFANSRRGHLLDVVDLAVLIVAILAVTLLAQGVWRNETRTVRFGLLLLCGTALAPAARENLGSVAASVQGLLLFCIAQLAYSSIEQSDLPAAYAGDEAPPRTWISVVGILLGSAAVDAVLFAVLAASGTSRSVAPLLATVGTLCTIAIAGLVWVLATRTPPAH